MGYTPTALEYCMSTATSTAAPAEADAADLTDKQRRILEYLREHADQTYFKSRLVGEALDLSAKEVGANMPSVAEVPGVTIEKWGYSGATTWKVSV